MYNNYSAHFTSSYIIASAHLRIISKFPTPPSCHSDMVVTITSILDFQGMLRRLYFFPTKNLTA